MGLDISFDTWMIALSMLVVLLSYVLICYVDRSWLNWATPGYAVTLAAIFVFPLIALLSSGPVGSRFAYLFSYSTYAATNVCLAVSYALTRRIPVPNDTAASSSQHIGKLPWLLLAGGILFYAPILIRFSSLLLQPREIYEQTRTAYGPLDFGSRALLNLAFVTYLFKQPKKTSGSMAFFSLCLVMIFFHGSKGLLLNLLCTAMFYWVYVKGGRAGFVRAASAVVVFAVCAMSLFAFFGSLSDSSEILAYVEGYADYTKNAMIVIDDPAREPAWGRLTLEGEAYARVPRFLYPAKPDNFGMFKLSQDYYPEWFRGQTGDPDFNIGMQYADFGPLAILYLCITNTLTGIMTGLVVRSLLHRPSIPRFILVLFFSGIPVISFGAGYALPETLLIASGMWLVTRTRSSRGDTMQTNAMLVSPSL